MHLAPSDWQQPLLQQLGWFIRLRWIAALAVMIGSAIEWRWLGWYSDPGQMMAIGFVILAYNAILRLLVRRVEFARRTRRVLLMLAWLQILLDLGCLMLLTLLTGGLQSPLRGFFVFHMVFASLLLPRQMAYAGATVAIILLAGGLWATAQLPVGQQELTNLLGWAITLLLTVWLANRITRHLRHQRRRLLTQNRRIKLMSSTLQRQQQGMIQGEKMAAVGRMAAGVAHEVANPLASMDSLLQLAERRPEKLRPELLTTLREQIKRINQIVRQMTTFAHPGQGQWQAAGLNDVVDKALDVIRFDPRLNRVAIDRQFAPNLPPVRMLTEHVQQVVINLVINAVDAMENSPEPKLTLRTSCLAGWCSIEVADNGHGIGPEHRNKLFEPFFTTKPVGKGTGLGLSISYALIHQHGGEILVESRPGEGAKFTVRLPVAANPLDLPRNTPKPVHEPTAPKT
jgi:signal transduction histidine kinase